MTASIRTGNFSTIPIVAASVVTGAAVFILDLLMPLGVAAGVPYVGLVLISLYSPWRRYAFILAIVSTVLIVLGYLFSSPLGIPWVVIVNRLLAVFVVWITAEFCRRRMLAVEALGESEERFRSIFEDAGTGMVLLDRDGRCRQVNQTLCDILGYTEDELLSMKVSDISHPDEPNQSSGIIHRIWLGESGSIRLEKRYIHKDGRTIWSDVIISPVQDANGDVVAILSQIQDITEHKRAEEALRESEERFRTIYENAPVLINAFDENGGCVLWNNHCREVFGWTIDEMNAHDDPLALFYPDPSVRDEVLKTVTTRPDGRFREWHPISKDGKILTTMWANFRLPDGMTFNLGYDITERKQNEDRFKDISEKLQISIEQMPIAYILWDSNQKVLEWNKAAEKIFGYTSEEILEERFLELIVPDAVKHLVDGVVTDLFSGIPSSYSARNNNIRKDGQLISCQWHNTPIQSEDGKITAVLSMTQDVTERTNAEKALRESEEKYRAMAERIYDVVLTAQLDGEITYVSPSVSRVFGYQPEDLVGKKVTELLPEAEIPTAIKTFQMSAAGKDVEGLHTEFLKKDGSHARVELNAVPIYNDGKITGAQAVIRDVTETKRLQALESRAERLEMAGTIAGQVAHDFNNLLAPLMAYPEFIRGELPKNHSTLKYLDQIERAANKIADINQDLLAMGRRGHYNREALNLNTVIQHALEVLKPHPETLVCNINLSENLMDILGGGAQLHRMISNLLHNAKDAVQCVGQITVKTENYYVDEVSINYAQVPKGEYVKLTISDTGCGIADDIVQKIFDPFFTSKTTDKNRGSGLGMSVVDAVIKDHSGYIDLSTKVGEGTSFYIYLPVTRESSDDCAAADTKGGSETILVVDDDDTQREVSCELLSKMGYNVGSIESGEKAIEFLRENPRDLVILDMVLPGGIDGTETYRRIMKFSPTQKAIILSGFSETDRVLEAQQLGAGAFVKKPITRQVIAAAVRTELDRKVRVSV